jgi:hypothetical protein
VLLLSVSVMVVVVAFLFVFGWTMSSFGRATLSCCFVVVGRY